MNAEPWRLALITVMTAVVMVGMTITTAQTPRIIENGRHIRDGLAGPADPTPTSTSPSSSSISTT